MLPPEIICDDADCTLTMPSIGTLYHVSSIEADLCVYTHMPSSSWAGKRNHRYRHHCCLRLHDMQEERWRSQEADLRRQLSGLEEHHASCT